MTASDSCAFCRIARGESEAAIVYEDETVLAFRDIRPAAPTHILIIPRQHVGSVDEVTAADGGLLTKMVAAASEIARRAGVRQSGYRLVINTGPDGGQTVFHLHLHLLAGRHMKWPPG